MNQTLKRALQVLQSLPQADQEKLAQAFLNMALRKTIDAELAAAEARGGETPHAEVMAELRSRYGG
jgi:hypothetical protein